jgi:hypothetical protein
MREQFVWYAIYAACVCVELAMGLQYRLVGRQIRSGFVVRGSRRTDCRAMGPEWVLLAC